MNFVNPNSTKPLPKPAALKASPPIAPTLAQGDDSAPSYPGELATALAIRQLADEYRKAAHTLFGQRRRQKPLSLAPFRLSAIHAIELYLNAFLLHRGWCSRSVRGLKHDLARRAEMATENGLILTKGTAAHLHSLHLNREYVAARYGPELASRQSHITRLFATLEELGTKVATAIPF